MTEALTPHEATIQNLFQSQHQLHPLGGRFQGCSLLHVLLHDWSHHQRLPSSRLPHQVVGGSRNSVFRRRRQRWIETSQNYFVRRRR
jgi:hypothetical protein